MKKAGIQIILRQKTTPTKNVLAPLDSRMRIFGEFLTQELGKPNTDKVTAVANAVRKSNQTISAEGYRPCELFSGRLMDTGEQFRVPIEMLKEKTIQIRKNSRESAMKKRELNTRYRPMTFIPYNPGMTYDNRRKMPLKIGDMLLIDDSERKNNLKPFFEIIKHEGFETGIDWGNNMVATKRLGTNSKKLHIWDMSFIREVCEKTDMNLFTIYGKLTQQKRAESIYMLRENSDQFCKEFYM